MFVSCFVALFHLFLFCSASQDLLSGLRSVHILKRDGTLVSVKMFQEDPQNALRHYMCNLDDNELVAIGFFCQFLHEKQKTQFERQVIDFVTGSKDEIKHRVCIALLDKLLPQFEDFNDYFQKCRHTSADFHINRSFKKALFKKVENGEIKLAEAFVMILTGLIRKSTKKTISEEQKYVFGDYEMVEDYKCFIEESFNLLFVKKNASEVLLEMVNGCLQTPNAGLSKLRKQYLSGVRITDMSFGLTEKQRFTNFLLFVVLPERLALWSGEILSNNNGLPFVQLLLLKAHDHLNVMTGKNLELDKHIVTEFLKRFAGYTNDVSIFTLVDSIRRCNPHLIDEQNVFFEQLAEQKAVLEQKKENVVVEMKEKVTEQPKPVPETTAPVDNATSKNADHKKAVRSVKLYYALHPEKLQYFKTELLTTKDITETERNCLLSFEISFATSMAKLLALETSGPAEKLDERLALKERIQDLLYQYAKEPIQIFAAIINAQQN